jgi:T5SS/PEP-CTERM-associated repeat protein
LWRDATNWSTGLVPDTNTFANISSAIPCVVDATAGTAVCYRMNVADGSGSSGTLIVTNGGVLAPANNYCAIGYSGNGTFDVENGCSVIFPVHLWIGLNTGATGTFIMNGGTVTVLQMYGEGWSGGVGTTHVNGGRLILEQFSPTQSIGPGSILDIAGGTVIISGNYASAINNYIASGQITAYGGAGTVLVDYNNTNPGDTTITAINTTGSSNSWPQVIIPSLNTNEIVVASATPQEFGAVGDGITDDSAAFQNAMNAVYNSGGHGGGVVYVPPGNYAFYNHITIPTGVTLHGDWTDWTKGTNGLVGTTFKVYYGAGQTNAAPFIFLNGSTALRDVNIWYPNQNPNNIIGYPFTIGLDGDCVVQNVVLVNSYQGIQVNAATGGAKHILSTVIGTPLYMGISLDGIYDISHAEDVRFSPEVWPAARLTNSPAAGGAYAAWMRANGEGMQLLRVDGEVCMEINISGYKVGIEANSSTNGSPGATFYSGSVSNCGTALLAQVMPFQSGFQFANFDLDGDTAVAHTSNTMATLQFYDCSLIGRTGTAVDFEGPANNWVSWAQFQDCTISGTLQLDSGVFNAVNSSLNISQGSNQCVLGANATRAAFTGCFFSPSQSIVNSGNPNRVIVDGRRAIRYALPDVEWTNVVNDYSSRQPARTNLFVATSYGATGNGTSDDTAAIQSALAAAGTNGGGIVYLPGGKYHLTNTLDVPGGVVLHGPYEMRHRTWPGPDGIAKGAVLQPYGGQGTTNGSVAIALEANSGLVGVTISYETQNSNCIPFPPTIQGRGGNIYVIGVVCPNPYYYVDLDTYTCTNHLIYMVDGWALNQGYCVGNGSSGSIVDCHGNWTYWWDNYNSSSDLTSSDRPPVLNFAEHNLEMYVLGDCTELLVKDFVIPSHTFVHCISENGRGPRITGVATMCDETTEGFRLDAAAPCNLNTVNSTLAIFADYPDLDTNTVGVISSNSFAGTARFFNTALFGGPYWDFIVGGGDVGFSQVHMLDHSFLGSRVDAGVFHLVNNGAYISYNGASNFPPYNVAFGAGAGITGKASDMIGCYAYNGCSFENSSPNNPLLAWVNYNLATPLIAVSSYALTPPLLSINSTQTMQSATLTWPNGVGAFDLYYTPSLVPPISWTLITDTPLFLNNQWSVALTNNTPGGFYRLQQ